MTFAEAFTRLTQDWMPESGIQTHTTARLYRLLGDAASEIATSYGFMRYTYSLDISRNSNVVTIPEYAGPPAYKSRDILRIERVSVAGRQLRPAAREIALLDEAGYLTAVSGYPRYFYWRPENPSQVFFLPRAPKDSKIVISTLHQFPRTLSADPNNVIWNGQYEPFHDLVVLQAAVRAFEASFEPENAQVAQARLSNRGQMFSLHLQGQDLADMPVGGGQ